MVELKPRVRCIQVMLLPMVEPVSDFPRNRDTLWFEVTSSSFSCQCDSPRNKMLCNDASFAARQLTPVATEISSPNQGSERNHV